MATNRRLPFLLFALALLIAIQQGHAWWQHRSADLRNARERTHIIEVAEHGERGQRELTHSGELHDNAGDLPDDVHGPSRGRERQRTVRSIAGRIDLEQESLSALFELHECDPGSPLCSTGGTITVFSGDQRVCVISVGILQPSEDGAPRSDYQVAWDPRDEVPPLTDSERVEMLRRLAGGSELPDRTAWHRLLREAYGSDPQPESSAVPSELIAQKLVRAILMAIVGSRTSNTSTP